MAALLVSLAVLSVLMSVALPVWRHQARREKEEELIFRGEQYARAISLFQRKMGPGTLPPTFDVLVSQRFLRKKYKDPMTADGEFQPIFAGVNPAPGTPPPGGQGGRANPPGGRSGPTPTGVGSGLSGAQGAGGGILGVASKSREASIRVYKGRTHYNEWPFMMPMNARPGGPGADGPGGRGQPVPGLEGRGGRGGSRGTATVPGGRRGGPGGRGPGGRGPMMPGGRIEGSVIR